MNKEYRILFVCGNGVATSTAAAMRCQEYLGEKDFVIHVEECKVDAVEGMAMTFKPDVIIPTTILPLDICPEIKRFPGMPFMTGINLAKAGDELIEYLNTI